MTVGGVLIPQPKVCSFYILRGVNYRHANYCTAVVFAPICQTLTNTPFFRPMPTSKVQCRGCKRWFQPHGLSQHISKSQEARCRDGLTVSQVPLMSPSSYDMVMQTPLGPTHPSPVSTHGSPDHKYDHARDGQMSGDEAAAFTQGTR